VCVCVCVCACVCIVLCIKDVLWLIIEASWSVISVMHRLCCGKCSDRCVLILFVQINRVINIPSHMYSLYGFNVDSVRALPDPKPARQPPIRLGRQAGRQADRQTVRQPDSQRARQPDRQRAGKDVYLSKCFMARSYIESARLFATCIWCNNHHHHHHRQHHLCRYQYR
jgi:hypothetical protein